jgi:hypothetical protein
VRPVAKAHVCDPSQIGDMRIWNAREGWFLMMGELFVI